MKKFDVLKIWMLSLGTVGLHWKPGSLHAGLNRKEILISLKLNFLQFFATKNLNPFVFNPKEWFY
jgi:hypothetical protein